MVRQENSFGGWKVYFFFFSLFSVAVHEIGHCIGLFHNTEDKDSITQTIYKPGFSVENKNKILCGSDIQTVQEMYGAAKMQLLQQFLTLKNQKS